VSLDSARASEDRSGPWLLAGITLFWGLNFVTIKYSVAEVPIWAFRTICLLTGGCGLLGIAKAAGFSLRVPRAEWRPLVIAAVGNITGWHIFSAWGLQYVPASRGTILAYTMPLFAAVISVLWLKQKMTGLIMTALVSGIVALAILLVPIWSEIEARPFGPILMLLAAACWGFGTVAMKRYRFTVPTTVLAGWQMLVGGIPVFIGWALIDIDFDPRAVSHVAWISVAYSAVVPMIFCQWAFFRIVRLYPAAVAAISTLAIPVVSVIAAALLKHEPIGVSEILSLGLVLMSLALVLIVPALRKRAAPVPEERSTHR
jgi:drug/metabolite transporter (DMT)-like permease